MLKGIHPLLSPDLLWVLAAMGHGDDLAVVDLNHPAHSIASQTRSGKLIQLPGIALDRAVQAILTTLPLDDFTPDPVRCMQVVGDALQTPPAIAEVAALLQQAGERRPIVPLERFAFYEAAKSAFAVVQVGDPRFYANVLLRKGAVEGSKP